MFICNIIRSISVNSNKEYYPQIFWGEWKYAIKGKKIVNTINEDLKLNESDDESDECLIRPCFENVL